MEVKQCPVCGAYITRLSFDLCLSCKGIYGERYEWPKWLLEHVRNLDREHKATSKANERNRILDDERGNYDDDGTYKIKITRTESAVSEDSDIIIGAAPAGQIEHLPRGNTVKDPHAPFERITAKHIAIDRLSGRDKQLYNLHYRGFKQSEMARMLGISQGEVSKRLGPLLDLLRDSITLE